jgi:hypothetical protein
LRELDIDQATDTDAASDRFGRVTNPVHYFRAKSDRRQGAGGIAGVDACLLDVLHDSAEIKIDTVIERIDVDLHGVIEEVVDEHRVSW